MGRITNKIIPNNGKPYPKNSKNIFFPSREKIRKEKEERRKQKEKERQDKKSKPKVSFRFLLL